LVGRGRDGSSRHAYNAQRATCPNEPPVSDQRPVGFFDSGVGGITVLREVHQQLPHERCLYFADTRECPYGTKPVAEIQRRCETVVDFLLDRDAKAIVVACNAASVAALTHLRSRYRVPFIGIVPGIKPAARLTRVGRIGVLTTPTTAESDPLAQLIEQFAYGVTVMTQVCPGLVPLVEQGKTSGPEVEEVLDGYLGALLDTGVDVIVLGCTHYPFLREPIQRKCGPGVTLIDPSDAVARQLGRVLEGESRLAAEAGGSTSYYTSGEVSEFEEVLTRLVGTVDGPVERASI
jgi:glutamate racemase